MKKREAKKLEPNAIPEVVEFLDAKDALADFRQDHEEVFNQLSQLVERYNTTLEQAEKVCRAEQVSCGPFDLYQFATKYSAEALYNAVGRDKFIALGGMLGTTTTYEIDRGKLEAAISQRKLAEAVVAEVRTETPNFHKPSKLVIP